VTAADALRRLLADVRDVRGHIQQGGGINTLAYLADWERLALDGLAGEDGHVCKCENGPCPKCGGGPSGEWFEGHEVTCDDCGAELVVATVDECHGRSTFELIEYHDGPTEEGQP